MTLQPRYHEYILRNGYRALAGRSDSDNDELTFHVAQPEDWWFHIKGMPGSHVVLLREGKPEPGKEILKQVAAIAAWHSKARDGGVVAVVATKLRYVRKPRGAKSGTVTISKETVFKVRPWRPEADNPEEQT